MRADIRHRQKVRNRKKRQKLRSCVKEKSRKDEKTAESLHESKVSVGCARKNGRKFTRVRTEGASRMCRQDAQTESAETEEAAESLQ